MCRIEAFREQTIKLMEFCVDVYNPLFITFPISVYCTNRTCVVIYIKPITVDCAI